MPNNLDFSILALQNAGDSKLSASPDVASRTGPSNPGNMSHQTERIFKLGEEGSCTSIMGEVQDFYCLKKKYLTTRESDDKLLFEDPTFPAIFSSIDTGRKKISFTEKDVKWMRPSEIVYDPQFFVDGFSRFDLNQGQLGDCWLISSMANLAMHPELFFHVVPTDQTFGEDYAGIFHFRLWQYGHWVDVVIDDLLPTNQRGELIFVRSTAKNEFWCALLEKAYAKLCGSWDNLAGGYPSNALQVLTGGVSVSFDVGPESADLFDVLIEAQELDSPMAIYSYRTLKEWTGLVDYHSYTITKVYHKGKYRLVRLRNPWGKWEWNGLWSDESSLWDRTKDMKLREKLSLVVDDDGEFWIPFEHVIRIFANIVVCYTYSNSLTISDLTSNKEQMEMSTLKGERMNGLPIGECDEKTLSFSPQYFITLEAPGQEGEDDCTLIVELIVQSEDGEQLNDGKVRLLIHHLPENPDQILPKPLNADFFMENKPVFEDESLDDNITSRIRLPAGSYCITANADKAMQFVLRVLTAKPNYLEEYDQAGALGEIDAKIRGQLESHTNHKKLQETFEQHSGEDLAVDYEELREVLDEVLCADMEEKRLGENICRDMVALLGEKGSEKLRFEEFEKLWYYIEIWRASFKLYCAEGCHRLSIFKLREALNSAGYYLNTCILTKLGKLCETEDGMISFNDYVGCAARLQVTIDESGALPAKEWQIERPFESS